MKIMMRVPGMGDVKNLHSIGARSIPKVLRSSHLELYLLKKEMERLEKEIFLLDKKRNSTGIQLDCVNRRINKLQKEIFNEPKNRSAKTVLPKFIKTMPIKY